jgi:hypothetical protein
VNARTAWRMALQAAVDAAVPLLALFALLGR